jgi:hypothetical protein
MGWKPGNCGTGQRRSAALKARAVMAALILSIVVMVSPGGVCISRAQGVPNVRLYRPGSGRTGYTRVSRIAAARSRLARSRLARSRTARLRAALALRNRRRANATRARDARRGARSAGVARTARTARAKASSRRSTRKTPPIYQPPAAPAGLVATQRVDGVVGLSWRGDSRYSTAFFIQRRTASDRFRTIGAIGGSITRFSDMNVIPGANYTYRVQAVNHGVPSAFSNLVTVHVRR